MSSIDYPDELSAVIFCQGCPWRCRYCRNGHLLDRSADTTIRWAAVEAFLRRRRGLLDAVVFSGGEPTVQSFLASAAAETKSLGYRIGLHTAGCYPQRLRSVAPLFDWVGLDIKALPADYAGVTGVPGSGARAWESLAVLRASGTRFEVRTTLMPGWTLSEHIAPLMQRLAQEGIGDYVVQTCRTSGTLDPGLGSHDFLEPHSTPALLRLGRALFRRFAVR